MKKIILPLLILISINGLAQFPATQSMGTVNTRVVSNGAFHANKGLINGVYDDTTAANAGHLEWYNGAQFWSKSDRNFWLRDSVLNMWIRMARFSDVSGGSLDTTYTYKNTLYNEGIVSFFDDFNRNYIGDDYTVTMPATTETISSNGLRLVGTPNDYNNYISRTSFTASENFEVTLTYVNNTISAATFGVAIGVQSRNFFCCQHDVIAGVLQNTGNADLGSSYIRAILYGHIQNGTDAISSISVGDTIQIQLKRVNLTYISNTRNITTGETSTDTAVTDLGLTPNPFYANNTSLVTAYFFSGDINVIGWEYRLLDTWNADYAFVGNSITQGQAATAYSKTFPNRTFENDSGISVITSAGGGDVTAYVLTRLPELYKLKPRYVALMIGGNDIFFSVPAATWKANLLTIRDSLVNHGIGVIHLAPTPRTATDMTDLRNYIDTLTEFQNDIKVLATFDSLLGSGTTLRAAYDAGDGVHLTDSGHHYVALKIREIVTPTVRTPIPTIPLMSLIADGYDVNNKKLFLNIAGKWDTIPSPSGSTPNLQAVTTVGNSTTDEVLINASDKGAFKLQVEGNMYLGNSTAAATATPEQFNMGGTVSNDFDDEAKLKIQLFNGGAGFISGIGVANDGSDRVMTFMADQATGRFSWITNAVERLRLNAGGLHMIENGSSTTPPSGYANIYPKSDGLWYGKDDAGVESRLSNLIMSKGLTLESPGSAEDFGMWKTQVAITVSSINAVVKGSSPSVTINIAFGSDITSLTNVFSAGTAITNTTTGQTINSGFNDATIPAGSWIRLISTASSGTITQIEVTINYTED